jgi:hypothetical protein
MTNADLKYDVSASQREDLLDEALEESFPASDPVSLSPASSVEAEKSASEATKAG